MEFCSGTSAQFCVTPSPESRVEPKPTPGLRGFGGGEQAVTGETPNNCMYLSLSLSLYIYIYMYIHIHLCIYLCIYVYIHTSICIYLYACVYIYIHDMCMYVHGVPFGGHHLGGGLSPVPFERVPVQSHSRLCIRIHIYIYICVYTPPWTLVLVPFG